MQLHIAEMLDEIETLKIFDFFNSLCVCDKSSIQWMQALTQGAKLEIMW